MVAGSSPIEVHRVEVARAIVLLRDLTVDDWARPVDPPELAGWTVHDVAVHLAANQSLLADRLGVPVPAIPETATDDEGRTARPATATPAARLRSRSPSWRLRRRRPTPSSRLRGEARLDELIDWWGWRFSTSRRAGAGIEAWTHADDIRRAIGAGVVDPSPASLLTMAHAACGLVPSMLAVRGRDHAGRLVRFRFTDLGAAWDVDLGGVAGVRPAGDDTVDADIAVGTAAVCRGVSARVDPRALTYDVVGDGQLARDVVDALPALAFL